MLAKIGIDRRLDGKLTVDATKLDAAFTANFDAIGELFSTRTPVWPSGSTRLLDPYLQTGGVFDGRTDEPEGVDRRHRRPRAKP